MLGLSGGAAKFSANVFGSKLTFSAMYKNYFEVVLLLLCFGVMKIKDSKGGIKKAVCFPF